MLRKLENKIFGRTKTIDKKLNSLDDIKSILGKIDENKLEEGIIKYASREMEF